MSQLPADNHLKAYAYNKAQADDPVCSQLIHSCHSGSPEQHKFKRELLCYWPWPARTDLFVCKGLLLYSVYIHVYATCFVVPKLEAAARNPLQDPSWTSRNKEMLTSSDHISAVAWSFFTKWRHFYPSVLPVCNYILTFSTGA